MRCLFRQQKESMNKHSNIIFSLLSGMCLAVFLSSCASLNFTSDKEEKRIDEIYKKGSEANSVAPKMGEKLVRAIVENDSKAFLKELPEKLIQEFGKKDFDKTRESMVKELGVPVSYTYLRNMAHPVATICLWVIRFERVPTDPAIRAKNKKTVMEVLFRVVYGKIEGKNILLSFNFY